ncbi:MAG: hypothetical protein M1828_000063 [Chrysothrix sp. TS-e1954]|nr:MAG: hypothetical protein M1828_000063 [Chrysothrix sp. TS-e1954]
MASTTPSSCPTRIAVFVSGSGTNLASLITASTNGTLPVEISLVLSSSSKAYALTRASDAQIPTITHNILPYKRAHPQEDPSDRSTSEAARDAYMADLARIVLDHEPSIQLIVLAGFMLVMTPSFLDPVAKKGVPVINLHPSLPQAIIGTDAIPRAWSAFQEDKGQNVTGVTIHYVICELDKGPAILYENVRIRDGESLEELEERMHRVEHRRVSQADRLGIRKADMRIG